MNIISRPQKPNGFSLIEIMVTIAIIVSLSAIGISGFQFVMQRTKTEAANIQINLLSKGLEDYKLDYGDYPGDTDAGGSNGEDQTNLLFRSLYYGFSPDDIDNNRATPDETADEHFDIYLAELDPANNGQGWISNDGGAVTIVDPWNQEYHYRRGTSALNPDFDLWSTGPDGTEPEQTDEDNITNF